MSGYLFEKRSISDCLGYGSESVGSALAGGVAAAVGATLEELKAMVEFHLERVAPMLDLEVIPKARIANQPVGVDQSANGK